MNPITKDEIGRLAKEEKRALLKRLLLEKAAATREYPISCGQRALWFVYKMQPESAAYNVAFTARLRIPLDLPAFRRALLQLLRRHAALRTTFVETDGDPIQRVSSPTEGAFRRVDVSDSEVCLHDQVLAEHRKPFDISKALFRVTLFHSPDDSEVLLITVHHLVFDAGSAQILFDDLRGLYERETCQSSGALPYVPVQYSDYVSWQRELISSPEAEALSEYWDRVLAPPPPALNFAELARPSSTHAGQNGSIPLKFDKAFIGGLREVARRHNATLYMVLLTALQVLLHRYTGHDDVIVGCPASGRNQARWLGVIGYFINMLPIRSVLSRNPTFADHLARTREELLGALAHQDFPFPVMIERLRSRRENPAVPLIQVMFNLVTSPRSSDAARLFLEGEESSGVLFGDIILEPYPIPQQEEQFALVLEAIESDGIVKANLKHSPGGPDRNVALAMAEDFHSLLIDVIRSPESLVLDLALPNLERGDAALDVIVL